jgi:hypothetical protein
MAYYSLISLSNTQLRVANNGWRCAAGRVLPGSEATPPGAARRKGDVAGFRSFLCYSLSLLRIMSTALFAEIFSYWAFQLRETDLAREHCKMSLPSP